MSILSIIQERNPLVLNLANTVTQQRVADAISFIGGSPLMTTAIDEAEELISISSSLVLNTGTANEENLPFFIEAGRKANKLGKPVVLDPVAVMLPYRSHIITRIMEEVNLTVIRGNSAEIGWFAKEVIANKGIDSLDDNINTENAVTASHKTGAIIVQSGRTDVITNAKKVFTINNHSPLFKINVGSGDMLSAIIGTFVAVTDNYLQATYEATRIFGESGEIATKLTNSHPGNFISTVLDVLYETAQTSSLGGE